MILGDLFDDATKMANEYYAYKMSGGNGDSRAAAEEAEAGKDASVWL